jgi:hypothetical protein
MRRASDLLPSGIGAGSLNDGALGDDCPGVRPSLLVTGKEELRLVIRSLNLFDSSRGKMGLLCQRARWRGGEELGQLPILNEANLYSRSAAPSFASRTGSDEERGCAPAELHRKQNEAEGQMPGQRQSEPPINIRARFGTSHRRSTSVTKLTEAPASLHKLKM